MSTLLQRGYRLLNRAMEPAAAESVRYLRGAVAVSDAMRAALVTADIQQIRDGGAAVVGKQFVWRLYRSDLMTDSGELKPQQSDRIEWDWNGKTYVFVAMTELNRPEYGAVDPRGNWVPVSTKLDEVK